MTRQRETDQERQVTMEKAGMALKDDFLQHAVIATSQYDDSFAGMAAEILRLRALAKADPPAPPAVPAEALQHDVTVLLIAERERRDPTAADFQDPRFDVIWELVKRCDVTTGNGLFSGATGNDVCAILDRLDKAALGHAAPPAPRVGGFPPRRGDTMRFQHEPSHLDIESPLFEGKPHLWIQWKGTNVCCDIHCACGAHLHFDGDFLYFFQCPHCQQYWESGTHVAIYPVTAERAGDHVKQPDRDADVDFPPEGERGNP